MAEPEFVLYHRLATPSPRRGARRVPALWDGERLHEGARAIGLALGAIIAAEERPST